MAKRAPLVAGITALADALRDLAEILENSLDGFAPASPGVFVATTTTTTAAFLSVRDLANRLRVDQRTIRRWRDERVLPEAITIGGVIRWRAETIEAWLADQEEAR